MSDIIVKFKPVGHEKLQRAVTKLKTETDKATKSGSLFGTRNKRNAQSMGNFGNTLSTARSKLLLWNFAMGAAIKVMTGLAKQAAKLESLRKGFDNLTGSAFKSNKMMTSLKIATNGTMSEMDLMTQANNAMTLGITSSSDEMAEMFDMSQRLGRSLGVDTVKSIEALIVGLGRQSVKRLDDIGIVVKSNEAYQKHAAILEKTASQLTDTEKRQAFFNAALESARKKMKALGPEVASSQDSFDQFTVAMSELGTEIGEFILPHLSGAMDKITEFMRGFTETPLERTIREMKDMGLETKDLELTLNALAISKATDNIAEGFENQRNVANKINVALNWKKRLLKDEATIMQDITAITNDEVSIKAHINQLIAEGAEQDEINAAQRLLNLFTENEERQAEAERRVEEGEAQMANHIELNRLEAERKKLTGDDTIEEETKVLKDQTKVVVDLDAVWAKFIATRKAQFKLEENARVAGKQALSDLQEMGKEFSAFRKLAQTAAIAQTLYDTYEGAQAAYLSFSKAPQAILQPGLYQALGIAAATAAVGAGLAKVSAIRKAQYGADFVTSGPQMMMVGEAGREQVSVTPLEGPNLEGPQSQGIVLNISGNVLHESFIEDNVIPQIREGLRLGENMGV